MDLPTPSHPPFAYGREADVYEMHGGLVLRVYRDGRDAHHEAGVMAHVAGHGYPVPAVRDVRGSAILMNRVDGPNLAQALLTGSLGLAEGAEILAGLLGLLHAIPATDSVPGHTTVHFDLHPENVLITAAGPVVIDWGSAGDGRPDLDTALSALILAEVAVGSLDHQIGAAAGAILDRFLEVAPGDPLRLLDDAVAVRTGQTTLSATEIGALPVAAARVRGVK